ncbi:MAG: hypothetical protein LBK95_10325, partial [Bifidobacteriaceae bacterium]|nr:hypothetical protein [Bifidobacteriaceae bacterium]
MNGPLANGHIVKIGIVSHDARATGAALRSIFPAVEPAAQAPHPESGVQPFTEYRGRRLRNPVRLRAENVFTENFWFEVIEPVGDEPSPWRDHLVAHGVSVCFVSIHVASGVATQADVMTGLGFEQIWFEEKGYERYAYFDTAEALGLLVEVKETTAGSASDAAPGGQARRG